MRGRSPGLWAGAAALGVDSPQAPWPQPPSQPPEAGGRLHRNTCGCKLGAEARGWDRRRARVADSRARDGHTSDSRATPIVCVCTTLPPSAQDASAACHVGFEGCSRRRGIRCARGCGVGLRLPPQQRALGPKSGPMQRYARAGCGTGRRAPRSAAGEVTSYLSSWGNFLTSIDGALPRNTHGPAVLPYHTH